MTERRRQPRVLFVDDERNILRTLRRLCRREPYEVLLAASGEEALEILADTPAEVIISDYRMPGMTGVELLARAKQLIPDSVRIVLSGFADTEAVLEAINKGEVYRYLAKPWDDHELLTTIRQGLEHHALLAQNRELTERTRRQNAQLQLLNENLESIVAERTRALGLSQDILEHLPVGVVGISREGEVVLTNACVQRHLPELAAVPPGTDVEECLPADLADLVRRSLASGSGAASVRRGGDLDASCTIVHLTAGGQARGCVLVLQPAGAATP